MLPHGVDIKWVEPMERDAFLKEGKIVVCLESSHNEDRNLARATLLYVAEDLIRESQRFIDTNVMRSANFSIARKMLMLDKRLGALKCLSEEYIEPEANKTPVIRDYVLAMERMDDEGLLTRILLREFTQLNARLSPALSDAWAIKETEKFTKFIKVFRDRRRDEEVPLRHVGEIIRVSLAPIARSYDDFNISFYVTRASECFRDQIDTLYILARGINIGLAKLVVEQVERANLYTKRNEWIFKIQRKRDRVKSYVAVLNLVTT